MTERRGLAYEPDYGPNSGEHGEATTPKAVAKLGRQIKCFVIVVLLVLLGMVIQAVTR